jgi:hypothetical protein
MSYFDDDDWDPEYHTEEEIAAHEEERLAHLESEYENNPVFRAGVDELADIEHNLDAQREALEQLQQIDPVGAIVFAEDDRWLDARLSQKPPND